MANRTSNSQSGTFIFFIRLPLLAALFLLLGMGTFSRRGFLDWRRMVRQNEILDEKILALHAQKENLNEEVRALQNDPQEQERVVRTVLGYIKSNETVIEFE
jgi:cell division protein FtsB